ILKGVAGVVRLEAAQLSLLHEQALEHRSDRVGGAEGADEPCAALARADDGEVARPRLAEALPVERQRGAGDEVGLTDEVLPPPLNLDDYGWELVRPGGNGGLSGRSRR